MKGENKPLLTNCEKIQKLALQFGSADIFNLEHTSPIVNQVTQDFESMLNQENVFDYSWGTDLEEGGNYAKIS